MTWTRTQAIKHTQDTFQKNAINNAANEARWLVTHICETTPERQRETALNSAITARLNHTPLAYIIGTAPFLDWDVIVSKQTLIPRPETEQLVDIATTFLRENNLTSTTIADLGTGTGCIAVSLLKRFPNLTAIATDISKNALSIAQQNARAQNVENRLTLLKGNWCEPIPLDTSLCLILANPPYIRAKEWPLLSEEVKQEPKTALVSGERGTEDIQSILRAAAPYPSLKAVMIEGSFDLKNQLKQIALEPSFTYNLMADHSGHDRILIAKPHAHLKKR